MLLPSLTIQQVRTGDRPPGVSGRFALFLGRVGLDGVMETLGEGSPVVCGV